MLRTIFKSKLTYILLTFYGLLLIWWLKIFFSGIREMQENYLFGFIYAFVALIGGINGLIVSKKWGGWKSFVGRGLILFSFGLLGEWFGQTIWTYYNVIEKIQVPYPSLADIGYFSIIPFYAFGMLSFAKAAGAKFTLRTIRGKIVVVAIPVIMVFISYFLFLKDLAPDFSSPLKTFLDFGYPFGEAITISVALVTFELSRGILGGKMKDRILFLIFALIVQYITDYTFLYQASAGTYYNAGIVDFSYVTSFTIMTLGLIGFKSYD